MQLCGSLSILFLFPFILISWRLITLQYCSGFCHTLTWMSHGFTCVPHSEPLSQLPSHPIPLGQPSVPALSTCLMHSLALPFFEIGMKTDLFQSCGHWWVFQICWHISCSTFTASSSRIWNSSTRIPSPPLALFVVMLPKIHLTSHSRMSGSRWVSYHHDYLGCEDPFCTVLLCILANSS